MLGTRRKKKTKNGDLIRTVDSFARFSVKLGYYSRRTSEMTFDLERKDKLHISMRYQRQILSSSRYASNLIFHEDFPYFYPLAAFFPAKINYNLRPLHLGKEFNKIRNF